MKPTRVRHVVLWLTVVAYMITYMDRVVMSAAAPSISEEFGFDKPTMSLIMGAFRWGYALFNIPAGWVGDILGPRAALSVVVTLWSIFTSLTALAWGAVSMMSIRFLFGIGEAGAFPIATRSLSRWMLPTERGWAQGVTHAGSRLGAAITPFAVVYLIAAYGWRTPFFVFGVLGVAWAVVWYFYYRNTPSEHRSVNAAELELIQSRNPSSKVRPADAVPWGLILRNRNLWTLSAMYFCYGWCLAVYLDWFPTYLKDFRGFDLKAMGFFAMLPLLAGTIGDLLGGLISDWLGHRTGDLRRARSIVGVAGFLIAAANIIPATFAQNPYVCVAFTCLAFFGLELTVGVSWAVPLDVGGDFAGSVSAVMNTCGNVGGAISTTLLGFVVKAFSWNHPFVIAAIFCVIGAVLFSRVDATRHIVKKHAAQ